MKGKKKKLGAFSQTRTNGVKQKKNKAKKVASAQTIRKAISKLSLKKTERAEVPANNRNKRLYNAVLAVGQNIQRVERLSFKKSKSKVKARADVLTTRRPVVGRDKIEHVMIITDVGEMNKNGVFEEALTLIKRALEDSSVDSVHLGRNVDRAIIDQISILHPSLAGAILLDLGIGADGSADELIDSLDIDRELGLGESEASAEDSREDDDLLLAESEASVEDSFDANELEREERRAERLQRERLLLREVERSDNFQANIDRLQVRLAIIQNELGRAKGKEEEDEDSEYGDLMRERELLQRILWEEERALDESRKEVDSKVRRLKNDIVFSRTGQGPVNGLSEVEKNAIRRFGPVGNQSRVQLGATDGQLIEHAGGKNTLIIEQVERKRVGDNYKLLAVLDSIGGDADNIIINLDNADDAPKLFKQIRNMNQSLSSRILFLDGEGKSINPFTVVKGLKRIPNYRQRQKDKEVRVRPEKLITDTASELFRATVKGPVGKIGTNQGFVKKPLAEGSTSNDTTRFLGVLQEVRDGDRGVEDRPLLKHPNLIARQVLSSRLDRLLGIGTLADEIFAHGEDGEYFGVTGQVNGRQVLTSKDGVHTHYAFNLRDKRILKGLADLAVMDAITGQMDRHLGNIFIDDISGRVIGIDNDMAFPIPREDEFGNLKGYWGDEGNALKGQFTFEKNGNKVVLDERKQPKLIFLQNFMDSETADIILNTDRNDIRKALLSRNGDPEGLDDGAITAALLRFDAVKRKAKELKDNEQLIDFSNDDQAAQAYLRMISTEEGSTRGRDYLHANYVKRYEEEYNAAGTADDGHVKANE